MPMLSVQQHVRVRKASSGNTGLGRHGPTLGRAWQSLHHTRTLESTAGTPVSRFRDRATGAAHWACAARRATVAMAATEIWALLIRDTLAFLLYRAIQEKEGTKHQPGRASCSQQLGCKSISLHFLWGVYLPDPVYKSWSWASNHILKKNLIKNTWKWKKKYL